MSTYLLLFLAMLFVPMQSVVVKYYQKKDIGSNNILVTSVIGLAAMLTFVVMAAANGSFSFSFSFLPYSIGFAVSYSTSFVFQILALSCGPMAVTALILSFSLLLPTFYGIIFLKEEIGIGFIIGIILMVACLVLVNLKDKAKNPSEDSETTPNIAPENQVNEKNAFSVKWLIFVILSFIGNGMCSIIQKMKTDALGAESNSEFMIIALLIIAVGFAAVGIVKERKIIKEFAKGGWCYAFICGILNGAVNISVLLLTQRMNVSLMFPLISVGGILFSVIFSVTLFKERLTARQGVGFAIGILSAVLLNL